VDQGGTNESRQLTRPLSGGAMTWWWLVLYYPIMLVLLLVGGRLDKRFAPGSVGRNRGDLALGCAILALPAAPIILGVGWVVAHNVGDGINHAA
jgi:hypothetical protein